MGFESRKVHFPEEILLNILVRLPAKSIGRCRCVSQKWFKLMKENPSFNKMHSKHVSETNRFNIMLYSQDTCKTKIHSISYDPSSPSICSALASLSYPLKHENTEGIGFLGSSCGLICFTPGSMVRVDDEYVVDMLVVWNPTTGEYKKLAPAPIVGHTEHIDYGFCYDCKIDEFKVVSLAGSDGTYWSDVHVYTQRSNSWIAMKKIPYNLLHKELQVPDMGRLPVNGAFHWLAFRQSGEGIASKVILSFDFEKQVFHEMTFPNMFHESFGTNLCVLEGSLCLLGYKYKVRVDLWQLKNDGVENSWNKLFTIDIKQLFGYVGYLIPLRHFESGEILLGYDKNGAFNIGLYNLELQTFKTLKVYDKMTSYSVCTSIYEESLRSPCKGTYLKPAAGEEEVEPLDPSEFCEYEMIVSATKENKPRIGWHTR